MKVSQVVMDEIQRLFAANEVGQIVADLESLSDSLNGQDDPIGEDRIRFAILKLSQNWLSKHGNLSKFRHALELTETDFRDVLSAAGMADWNWPDVVVGAGMANSEWHRQVVEQLGDLYSPRRNPLEFWKRQSQAKQAAEQRVIANTLTSVPDSIPRHPLNGELRGATIYAEQTINVGQAAFIDSASPTALFAVAFEDDGKTGYLYALDLGTNTAMPGKPPILDALHIYNVADVVDRDIPSILQIAWSNDGVKAVLFINDYAHAVFDFQARRGYARTGFPPPDNHWTLYDHTWDDSVLELFK